TSSFGRNYFLRNETSPREEPSQNHNGWVVGGFEKNATRDSGPVRGVTLIWTMKEPAKLSVRIINFYHVIVELVCATAAGVEHKVLRLIGGLQDGCTHRRVGRRSWRDTLNTVYLNLHPTIAVLELSDSSMQVRAIISPG